MDTLRVVINGITPIRQHPHALFLGGVFAYDMLAGFENLPAVDEGENDCPDFVFYLAETLITVDHQTRETHLIGSVFSGEDVARQYFAVSQRLESLHQQLHTMPATPSFINKNANAPDACAVSVDKTDAEFCHDVHALKQHILAGDIFQVVP